MASEHRTKYTRVDGTASLVKSVRMEESTLNCVQAAASTLGRSFTSCVNEALEDWLEKPEVALAAKTAKKAQSSYEKALNKLQGGSS